MRKRTLGLNVALRGERLHGLDDLKVLNVGDLGVSRGVEVLGGNENTLCLSRREGAACGQRGWSTSEEEKDQVRTLEEVLEDGLPVLLGDEHI